MTDPARIPVVVGVGQVNDRPGEGEAGRDSLQLMIAALEVAERDGGGQWLRQLDSLAVVRQIAFFDAGDLSMKIAEHLAIAPPHCEQTPLPTGESPIELLNEAANRIAAGESQVCAVVGGEALRNAAKVAVAQGKSGNASAEMSAMGPMTLRKRYGLSAPVDVYPLYENACRAAWGQTFAEAQAETGVIWSRFSEVAAANPGAWLRQKRSPGEIVTADASNRPIAFPYTKLMVANSSVNQGAAFIVTSLAKAREAGFDESRLVYVGPGAAGQETDEPLDRSDYVQSPSMAVALERALSLNGITAGQLDFVEFYSCFPCVPKMARRVLDWPLDKPATVFGGLTFGGGPIGNYMSHAVVSMVLRLREEGRFGLLFANGGFATHNHALVLRRDPPAEGSFPQDFHYQAEADARRALPPTVLESYAGPGTIETYTVLFDRHGGPRHGVVIARTPAGERFLAKVPGTDAAGLAALMSADVEPVGSPGTAELVDDLAIWRAG